MAVNLKDVMAGHGQTVFLNANHFAESVTFNPEGAATRSIVANIHDERELEPVLARDGKSGKWIASLSVDAIDATAGVPTVLVDRDGFTFHGRDWIVKSATAARANGTRDIAVESIDSIAKHRENWRTRK